jgi:uncharacterized protein (TIGR02145 family)
MAQSHITLITSPILLAALLLAGCGGDPVSPAPPTVTDADGNVYHTVTIGTQVWIEEDLRTTRYNDGRPIPLVADAATWGKLTTPAYCWYDNDGTTYKNTYGALYNWHAVNSGKLAPAGWHIPSDSEWTVLSTFLGGESVAAAKLKEAGSSHWTRVNAGTNSSGFTALPAGCRSYTGAFVSINEGVAWWSRTQHSDPFSWLRLIYVDEQQAIIRDASFKTLGCSVRCVKDAN